ncbi:MAG TPA: cupin domain-containing protein [Lachnospiraceae bacterium]|nr:cupin domain-containing protein [Lachnospiraceae bacterium]
MGFIKNIDHETVLSLADTVQTQKGQVISKTLAQNEAISITIFSFSKGEEIGKHDSDGDAMVTVLEGVGKFIVGDKEYLCEAGQTLVMPAKIPHAVYAQEDFKMLLVVVFP